MNRSKVEKLAVSLAVVVIVVVVVVEYRCMRVGGVKLKYVEVSRRRMRVPNILIRLAHRACSLTLAIPRKRCDRRKLYIHVHSTSAYRFVPRDPDFTVAKWNSSVELKNSNQRRTLRTLEEETFAELFNIKKKLRLEIERDGVSD